MEDWRFDSLKLSENTKKILKSAGYTHMTQCQYKSIPLLYSYRDVIVKSPTGTGKTLAYIVPCLESKKKGISSLIIVPTRELAAQIREIFYSLSNTHKPVAFTGGIPIEEDLKKLQEDPRIVVGTPGRLLEIIKVHNAKFLNIEYLILDEADKLLYLGFQETLCQIMTFLKFKKTTGLFSATLDETVYGFSSRLGLQAPERVDCLDIVPSKLVLYYLRTSGLSKLHHLMKLLTDRSIVFFSTCASVDFFHLLFTNAGLRVRKIHGKMLQKERIRVYEETGCPLFCTDVAARGIDFHNVDMVIHFDVPTDPKNFVHRCGRTARNGKKGDSVLMLMENEMSYVDYLKVKKIDVLEIDSNHVQSSIGMKVGGYSDTSGVFENNTSFSFDPFVDSEALEISARAFVSYVRSYKEHVLNFILDYRDLNLEELAGLHLLKRIPKMIELSKIVDRKQEDNIVKKRGFLTTCRSRKKKGYNKRGMRRIKKK